LPDDPRLFDAFAAAGALGLPVLMHTADPVAFFAPVDRYNERLEELAAHPDWWFGGDAMPPLSRLLDAFEAVVAAHPGTTFIGAHVGNCAEDLAWVCRLLDTYPNLAIDIAARLGELGRQPRATRRLIIGHPDRVLFGTDCFPPSGADYALHFRFLESDDEHFDYSPGSRVPPQGRWRISAIDLPREVLEQVYAGNARRLLRISE
jgi:predicted TIM-barrel fold metal-dependent hydrolase